MAHSYCWIFLRKENQITHCMHLQWFFLTATKTNCGRTI